MHDGPVIVNNMPLVAIPLTGTLGMLVQAKNQGYLTEVAPLIHELQMAGIFFSESLVADVLMLAGESD